jgi:rhodanese-related sulfurtransferase
MTTPDALSIPINVLFKPENLDRVPTDRKVDVGCASGTRATAAGIALRQVGFENVYVLKGGLNALAGYLNPKTANMPLASAN